MPGPHPVPFRFLAAPALVACGLLLPAAAGAQPPSLTLEAAVRTAFGQSPGLQAARARVAEAEARVRGAGTYPHNPELEGEIARRWDGEGAYDWEAGVSQELELAGQGGQRVRVARTEREAARARLARAERVLAAEVHLAFLDAVEAQALLELARSETELARSLLDLAERRLAAGAGTGLDVNVAAAELGRAEQAVGVAQAVYAAVRARLAEVAGLSPATLPVPEGGFGPQPEHAHDLEALLASAEAHRSDLLALREERRAAAEAIELARREAWPNLRLGAFAGREEGTDRIAGVALGVELPLFDRNQGELAERRATARRLEAELQAARLGVVREVVATYERHHALWSSLELMERRVLGTTERNVELLRRSFEAGKATWPEVLVMRRSLFEARRALVETRAEARRAHVTLDLAAGRMPLPALPASPHDGDDR